MGKSASILCALAAAAAVLATAPPASADEAARTATARHFAAGTLAAGDAELAAMIAGDPANQDARLGLGLTRFVAAVENVSQGLYRYGSRPAGVMGVPILRLPVPVNPDPEPITYEVFRGLLQGFVDDLAGAELTLATVDDDAVKVPIDLRKVAYDIDKDGVSGRAEHLSAALAAVSGMRESRLPADATVAFDRGDALWLRGYCHVFMAIGEFLLAHDWHDGFEASFHNVFPRIESDLAAALAAPDFTDRRARGQYGDIADAVSFIHLIRWPVTEPQRMKAARGHVKQVLALSRETWEAIAAETDDDREWLPGPDQHAAVVTLTVTDAQLVDWRAMLDEAEAVIDGDKLMPHWRFDRGFNLRRVFDEPTTFDLVLWITGPAALQYLEDGPVSTSADWGDMMRAFGRGFGAYLVWFN